MKKYFTAILLLSLLVITPVFAQTISVDQIIQAIKADPSLLAKVQGALKQLMIQSNPASSCYSFDKNLTTGSVGNDVRYLVRSLKPEISADYNEFNDNVFGWVKEFQEKNGLPNTGYVGPLTRNKLNALYGCSKNVSAPVISGISGPTTLKLGENGQWTINATDSTNGGLIYGVVWGDEILQATSYVNTGISSAPEARQAVTFNHTYTKSGNFRIIFTVSNSLKQETKTTITVTVTAANVLPITLTTPKAGDKWETYTTQNITWNYPNAGSNDKVDLYLDGIIYCIKAPCVVPDSLKYVLDKNLTANLPYNWIVGTDINNKIITPGNYTLRICKAGTGDCSSSGQFTITAATHLVQICPEEKINDRMPTITPNLDPLVPKTYYMLGGSRWETSQFDLDWVTRNCSVREINAY